MSLVVKVKVLCVISNESENQSENQSTVNVSQVNDSPSPCPVQFQMNLSVCSDLDLCAHSSSDNIEEGFCEPSTPAKKGAKKKGSSGSSNPRSASPTHGGQSPLGTKGAVQQNLPVPFSDVPLSARHS